MTSSAHGNGLVIAFSDKTRQRVTISATLNKPDNSLKLASHYQVCEAGDEELTAILAQTGEAEPDVLYIHCLFRKELFSLYMLLEAKVDASS